ncbi:MAG: hypothetical protein JOY99_16445 [Sphingomonadaceae bacterium]|nr:hypothetical protein [Sphingomonadaceae bacterium]
MAVLDRGVDISADAAARLAAPSAVRYIKLGQNGRWAPHAFETGTLPFGFTQVDHNLCAAADWADVRAALVADGRSPSGASQGVRELRDFYELDDSALWITFADGHLWWAFAAPDVAPLPNGGDGAPRRSRKTLDGWHHHALDGEPLTIRSLSSALTRVASFRMTLCKVEREAYLLRRLRGEPEPLHAEATAARTSLQVVARQMIGMLDWRDFEILVDLIFARGGWQRSSAVGDGEVDVDLVLESPVTRETAWAQVKSRANQAVLDDYLERFRCDGSCQHFFFAVHESATSLTLPPERGLHLWQGDALAAAALRAGLFDWLIQRTR